MMNLRPVFVICIILSVLIIPIHGIEAEQTALPEIDLLVDEALRNNPRVHADYQRWLAKREKARQVGVLPDPRLNYTYFGKNVETKVGPQESKYGVSQMVPFPGKLALKRLAVKKEAGILKERYEAAKRELIKNVKFTYYDIFWIDKAIDITNEEKDILDSLEKVAQRKFETNQAPQQDVIKAQVEISKLIDKLFILKQHRISMQARLNALLNRPKAAPFDKIKDIEPSEFNYALEDLHGLASENRQELIAANLAIERAKYEKSLASLDYLPDFSLGFNYIEVGNGTTNLENDGQDAWMATFTVHVPVWLNKQVAQVREKRANLKASRKDYEDVTNNVIYEVEDVYYKILAYADIVSLYKTALIPQTEQSFEAARTGYETGNVDFLNWLDAERVLLQTRLAYYKAIVDYEKSIAYLERVVGKDLGR